ncbi:MAG: carotenoid biosynthesis protein [Chloroflexota bacterium]|nr:carotenoid biosynthesis protein [Chloroflexota bacterium]
MPAQHLTPGWAGRVALWTPLGVYAFVYPFGIGLLLFGWMPPGAGWVGGVLLIAQGLGMAAWLGLNAGRRGVAAAVAVGGAAWALEAVGVTTGLPFGRYNYSAALGAWLGPVPAAIPFAWIASVAAAWGVAHRLLPAGRTAAVIGLAAALTTAQDAVLETIATRVQGYWTWAPSAAPYYGVPWANFATWAVATAMLAAALEIVVRPPPARLRYSGVPLLIYSMSLVMFGLLNGAQGFVLPALLAGGVLAVLVWRLR